ncbi:MAG TPA: hypothetical protein PKI05_12635, partial [Thermogutta sp.]|nr:hypothetical protein [Thermogutta sp.]
MAQITDQSKNAPPSLTRRQFVTAALAGGLSLYSREIAKLDSGEETSAGSDIIIDAAFPGGNILVERIDGDTVYLAQDLRDTEGWWFYWYFRVRGGAGRTVTFRFTNKDVFTCQGPAM